MTVEHEVVVRRSPRYFRFMALGAALGVLVTLILTFSFPEQPQYSRLQVFGFVGVIAATIGIALGALAAMLVDRLTSRRSTVVTMQALPSAPVEFAVVTEGEQAQRAAEQEELTAGRDAREKEEPNEPNEPNEPS